MEPEKKSNGALVGLIVIVVILILGGIYIWQSKVKNTLEQNKIPSGPVTPADTNALNALDKTINATDTNVGVDVKTIK
ncbi:MAG: hypothetical protein WC793_02150 [Candidatus Paceibacterota bacterium]|jgi:hypothetical protein